MAAMRFLLFREPQPTLRHVENDSAIPFKGDFPRKVSINRDGTRNSTGVRFALMTGGNADIPHVAFVPKSRMIRPNAYSMQSWACRS
jgi:hypothetical protein